MTDPAAAFAAYDAMVQAERPDQYVTDPALVAALVAASPFAPRRRWWTPIDVPAVILLGGAGLAGGWALGAGLFGS